MSLFLSLLAFLVNNLCWRNERSLISRFISWHNFISHELKTHYQKERPSEFILISFFLFCIRLLTFGSPILINRFDWLDSVHTIQLSDRNEQQRFTLNNLKQSLHFVLSILNSCKWFTWIWISLRNYQSRIGNRPNIRLRKWLRSWKRDRDSVHLCCSIRFDPDTNWSSRLASQVQELMAGLSLYRCHSRHQLDANQDSIPIDFFRQSISLTSNRVRWSSRILIRDYLNWNRIWKS